MKRNAQRELDALLARLSLEGAVPSLLLHSCCAPCSSYVLEYLSQFFEITVFYYNPNITMSEEYRHRTEELKRLLREMPLERPVRLLEGSYQPERFYEVTQGLEQLPEGGERCFRCYELRLREAARIAAEQGCDYFTTTLSISPMKRADKLLEIGERVAEEVGVPYLVSDFKKRNGYKRYIELSKMYGLYRQDYCGCIYSKQEAEQRQKRRLTNEI